MSDDKEYSISYSFLNRMCDFDPNPEINHDNLHKHGFSLKTAQAVFCDPYRTDDEYDAEHSRFEHRYSTIGMLPNGKIVVAWFTMRNESYRLITAREAENHEKLKYYDHVKSILGLV